MRKLAIRLLVLTVGVTALLVIPAVTPAEAKTTSRHVHMKKHRWHRAHHDGRAWYGAPAQPSAGYYSQPGPICPAIGKSFDCKIWPPPYEDDPDRKVRGH
jgi:hypothetical protein